MKHRGFTFARSRAPNAVASPITTAGTSENFVLDAWDPMSSTLHGTTLQRKVTLMAAHFRFPSRPSRLSRFVRYLQDLFDHVFGEPYTLIAPSMSRRQQLAAATEAARRLRRGASR